MSDDLGDDRFAKDKIGSQNPLFLFPHKQQSFQSIVRGFIKNIWVFEKVFQNRFDPISWETLLFNENPSLIDFLINAVKKENYRLFQAASLKKPSWILNESQSTFITDFKFDVLFPRFCLVVRLGLTVA